MVIHPSLKDKGMLLPTGSFLPNPLPLSEITIKNYIGKERQK